MYCTMYFLRTSVCSSYLGLGGMTNNCTSKSLYITVPVTLCFLLLFHVCMYLFLYLWPILTASYVNYIYIYILYIIIKIFITTDYLSDNCAETGFHNLTWGGLNMSYNIIYYIPLIGASSKHLQWFVARYSTICAVDALSYHPALALSFPPT